MAGAKVNPEIFKGFSRERLEAMQAAGGEVLECYRVLAKAKSNTVAEILRHQGEFFEWDHYPKGDVVDWETHSQYYYHAHPKKDRPGEHGHFHTFLRYKGMPKGAKPLKLAHPQEKSDERIGSHLISVSMDKKGFPLWLFTVNRWVTDETWYGAESVISFLDHFKIDHTHPSWATNRWLTAMIILFRPQIEVLVRERDQKISQWMKKFPGKDVFEDRKLELISKTAISVEGQIRAIEKALQLLD